MNYRKYFSTTLILVQFISTFNTQTCETTVPLGSNSTTGNITTSNLTASYYNYYVGGDSDAQSSCGERLFVKVVPTDSKEASNDDQSDATPTGAKQGTQLEANPHQITEHARSNADHQKKDGLAKSNYESSQVHKSSDNAQPAKQGPEAKAYVSKSDTNYSAPNKPKDGYELQVNPQPEDGTQPNTNNQDDGELKSGENATQEKENSQTKQQPQQINQERNMQERKRLEASSEIKTASNATSVNLSTSSPNNSSHSSITIPTINPEESNQSKQSSLAMFTSSQVPTNTKSETSTSLRPSIQKESQNPGTGSNATIESSTQSKTMMNEVSLTPKTSTDQTSTTQPTQSTTSKSTNTQSSTTDKSQTSIKESQSGKFKTTASMSNSQTTTQASETTPSKTRTASEPKTTQTGSKTAKKESTENVTRKSESKGQKDKTSSEKIPSKTKEQSKTSTENVTRKAKESQGAKDLESKGGNESKTQNINKSKSLDGGRSKTKNADNSQSMPTPRDKSSPPTQSKSQPPQKSPSTNSRTKTKSDKKTSSKDKSQSKTKKEGKTQKEPNTKVKSDKKTSSKDKSQSKTKDEGKTQKEPNTKVKSDKKTSSKDKSQQTPKTSAPTDGQTTYPQSTGTPPPPVETDPGGDAGFYGDGSPLICDTNHDGRISAVRGIGISLIPEDLKQKHGAAAAGDKMLAMMDANGNGAIDGTEVFGDGSHDPFETPPKKIGAKNGYEALKYIAQRAEEKFPDLKIVVPLKNAPNCVDVMALQTALRRIGNDLGVISEGNSKAVEPLGDIKYVNLDYTIDDQQEDGIKFAERSWYQDPDGKRWLMYDVWFSLDAPKNPQEVKSSDTHSVPQQ